MDVHNEVERRFRDFTSVTRFSGLDGLRAFSVLGVIWCHVTGPHPLALLNQGSRGVDLFFAISGFLVTILLLREYRRDGAMSLGNFFIRRTLRIFPLYFTVLAVYCVLVFFTLSGTPKAAEFWSNLPAFATYTSNWFVNLDNGADHGVTFYFAWSLATEEQFYLFWPPLLAALLLTKKPWLAAATALALVLAQVLARSGTGLIATVVGSLSPSLLFGAMFAVLLSQRRFFSALYPVLGHRVTPAVLFVLVAICLQFEAPLLLSRFLITSFVVSLCIREDTVLHGALTLRPLAFLGSISYGVYLLHMLAANAARRALGHQEGMDVFAVTVAVVTGMAFLSYRYLESPLLRVKDRFRGSDHQAAVSARSSPGVV